MSLTRKLLLFVLALSLLTSAGWLMAGDKPKSAATSSTVSVLMDENKRVLHVLNRFAFGPRPGDVEKVRAMGLDQWFEQQLHPEKIDNSAMEARLEPFRTLKMSTSEMVANFPPPQVLKMVENGRVSMPSDPARRAIYESRIAAYQQQQNNKQEAKQDNAAKNDQNQDLIMVKPAEATNDASMTPEQRQKQQQQEEAAMYSDLGALQLLEIPPDERYQKILKMSPGERLSMGRSLRGEQGMKLVDGMKPEQRETVQAIVQPQIVVGGELAQAKLLRAIYSDHQLEEVMTDFWYNHFNVFIGKGPDRYMITAYERDVIRPHVLGKFKDLLAATAKSPAMLFYLDNWQSVGPNSQLAIYGQGGGPRGGFNGPFARQRQQRQRNKQQQQNRPSGLNENYAREIMELH